jgi:hypothetical protein
MCNDGKTPCYQVNVHWSMGNTDGPIEPDIQKAWRALGIWDACVSVPGAQGRKTAMQIAIAAAKHGDKALAFAITRSTQLHNSSALTSIDEAGVDLIARYLTYM